MKRTKKVFRTFAPWQIDEEVEYLNEMSQKGWQLHRLGRFMREFVFDDTAQYKYALDYQLGPASEAHREMFADQGWERILVFSPALLSLIWWGMATDGHWYVFRKKTDPSLTEDNYQIYTDAPSLQKMKWQWYILPIIVLVLSFYTMARQLVSSSLPLLLPFLAFLIVDALIILQIRAMQLAGTGRRMKIRVDPLVPMAAAGVLLVAGLVTAFIPVFQAHPGYVRAVELTAENTPANVFLLLEPDTTMDDLYALADSYGLYTHDLYTQYSAVEDDIGITTVDITADEGYWLNKDSPGVFLSVVFAPEEAGAYFRSAALTVKTGNGTATCWYYPTDFTDQGHDTGFTVKTRAKGRLFDKTCRPDTAREALDLMYAVTYPDGFE